MLYNIVSVSAIHQHESVLVYMSPLPLEPPSHLPPHPISLGCHRTSDLSSEHHTANSQWLSISHLVMYMLQWYSLNSSHLLLPLCPQVCFYVCISFAGLQICYQYHFSRFCGYALIYNIHFSLSHFTLFFTYFTLYNRL